MQTISHMQAFIIDMDGVLWRGRKMLPGVKGFFATLRQRGLPFILATNNSTVTPEGVADRFQQEGIGLRPEEVLTSAEATAAFLVKQLPVDTGIYVIGEDALRDSLSSAGFRLQESGDRAQAVVVGFDRFLTYEKLARAAYALEHGALFVGTNPDPSFPMEDFRAPGNGATLAALQTSTGVAPIIIGKPEPRLFEQASQRLRVPPEQTLVIGDRLETDILGAKRARMASALVLTGVTRAEDLRRADVQPDWAFSDLRELTAALRDESP